MDEFNTAKGLSPTSVILKVVASSFPSLWTGLSEALSVVEGDVGGTEPDRFGALLRGYLAYLHLADESEEHYKGKAHCCTRPPNLQRWCLFVGVCFVSSLWGFVSTSFFPNHHPPPTRTAFRPGARDRREGLCVFSYLVGIDRA